MMPSDSQVNAIPITRGTEFEMSDRETKVFRRRLYAINRDGIRQFKTQRYAQYLLVWRVK